MALKKIYSLFILSCAALLGPVGAQAEMTLQGVSGASGYVAPTTDTTATIFGGMAGTCTNTPTSNYDTCNTCNGDGLKACNRSAIYPDLRLRVIIRTNNAQVAVSTAKVKYKVNTTVALATTSVTIAPDTDIPIEIRWGDLCSAADTTNTGCTTDFSKLLTVGIDNNNDDNLEESVGVQVTTRAVTGTADTYTPCPAGSNANNYEGLCDITLFPGDSKLYIKEFGFAPPYDLSIQGTTVKYDRLVFFYDPVANNITNSSSHKELTLGAGSADEGPELSDRKITGLDNNTQYCVAGATQDQAGNITRFTPQASITCETPEEVVGILDDKKCFIATATFGSQMAPEVVTFRKFRNEFLLTNEPGRAFVKWYYKYGPIGAEAISQSSTLKALSLAVLSPLLLFVKLSLAVGLLPALLMVLMAAVLAHRLVKQLRDQRHLAQEEP